MGDVEIQRDGELMVAHIAAQTMEAVEFIDSYLPSRVDRIAVVDSGRIILHTDDAEAFVKAAEKSGLEVEEVEGR